MQKYWSRAIWPRVMMAAAGLLGIVLFAGIMLPGSTSPRLLAAARTDAATTMAADPRFELATQRLLAELAGVASETEPSTPQAGDEVHAPIGSSLLDFQLPGTQPGGLIAALAESSSCTGCHVDHIRDNFNGSMMTNGVRDPLVSCGAGHRQQRCRVWRRSVHPLPFAQCLAQQSLGRCPATRLRPTGG